jgi:Lrp/AsnC family transcriptional regulator, regulator for asnA, asnC and gidA
MKFDDDNLLDDINLKIIDVLSKDSSVPFVEIAKQISISDATVHVRVRRLKDQGVINKFTLSIDNNLLGYDHLSFIGINIKPGLADQITKELANIGEILEVHEMYGRFDLFVKVRAKDLKHTRDIIENNIRILPNIVETQLMTVLKTKKEEQIASSNNHITESNTNTDNIQSKKM